jgi:hypothetical protein
VFGIIALSAMPRKGLQNIFSFVEYLQKVISKMIFKIKNEINP